jgi:hypothetical protein
LHRRVANDEISADDVPLDSRSQEDPVRIPDSRVLLDHVPGVAGINKTNTKVVSLGRIAISNEPVPTEPVAARAAGQSYAAAGIAGVAISCRNIAVKLVEGPAVHENA